MEKRIAYIQGNNVKILEIISDEDYDELKSNISNLNTFGKFQDLYKTLIHNFSDFHNFFKELDNVPTTDISPRRSEMQDLFFEGNRYLLNYLASFRLYIDHSDRQLKKFFGEESEERKRFKAMLSEFYDGFFSYRFLSELRNYIQHNGMPVGQLNYKANEEDDPSKMKGNYKLSLDRDYLLKDYKWKSIVKKELLNKDKNIDVFELVFQLALIISDVDMWIENLFDEKIGTALKKIEELYGEVDIINKEYCVVFDFNVHEKRLNTSFEYLSTDCLKFSILKRHFFKKKE